jgi:hypothetical protein
LSLSLGGEIAQLRGHFGEPKEGVGGVGGKGGIGEDGGEQCLKVRSIGPKKTVGLNQTKPRSGLFFGCGCPYLGSVRLLVASF